MYCHLTNLRASAILCFALNCACGGVTPNPGTDATVLIDNAQYFEGTPPVAAGGPEVLSLSSTNNRVFPGTKSANFSGSVADTADAVILGLPGDRGYWVVPVGPVDPIEPGTRTFDARVSFSRSIGTGPTKLSIQGVNKAGKAGPPNTFQFVVVDPTPVGALVVSLEWSSDADLDLHVLMPNPQLASFPDQPTVEIWSRHPSSYRRDPNSTQSQADGLKSAALLDFDSNASCVIDSRRRESIVIPEAPPFGTYVVRVDTASLCGQPSASWKVRVLANGVEVRSAQGVAVATDGYAAQGDDPTTGKAPEFGSDLRPGTAGSGAFALQFDY